MISPTDGSAHRRIQWYLLTLILTIGGSNDLSVAFHQRWQWSFCHWLQASTATAHQCIRSYSRYIPPVQRLAAYWLSLPSVWIYYPLSSPPPPQLAVKMSWSPKKRRNLSTHLSSYIRTRLSSRSSVPRNFRFAGPPILDKKVRHRQLFLSIAKSTNLENAHIHVKNMFCSNRISFLYERGL